MAEVKLKEEHNYCLTWEPPDIKEEPEPCPIKEEPEEIPLHVIFVKTEDDEYEYFALHQRPTEERREDTQGSDCGAEAGCSLDPLTKLHLESEGLPDSFDLTDHSDSEDTDSSEYTEDSDSEETDSSSSSEHSEGENSNSSDNTVHLENEKSDCSENTEQSNSEETDSSDHSELSDSETDSSEYTEDSEDYGQEQAPAKRSYAMIPPDSCVIDNKPFSRSDHSGVGCPEGGTSFEDNTNFPRHVTSVHRRLWPHTCSVCEEGFKVKTGLSRHLMHNHRTCPVCNKHIPDEFKLKSHLRTHVEEGTLDQSFLKVSGCSECGRCFRDKSEVKRHVLTVHRGERPHKCSICDKAFIRKCSLHKHLKTHTDRPFVCPVCYEGFFEISDLIWHQTYIHRMCPVCLKCFTDKKTFSEHLRTHVEEGTLDPLSVLIRPFIFQDTKPEAKVIYQGQTPHQCPLCVKRYERKKIFH